MTEPYEGWAIVELMGHRRLAGYVTEVEAFGAKLLRLDVAAGLVGDVPDELQGTPPTDVAATQFYSSAALYCLTPTTERIARAVGVLAIPQPVARWELPRVTGEAASVPADESETHEWVKAGDEAVEDGLRL